MLPAAIAIIVKETPDAEKVLLVRRSPQLPVQGGAWAFPGGRIDPVDGPEPYDLPAALACAIREVREETALHLAQDRLEHIARWVSPEELHPRFDTWVFRTAIDAAETAVRVDGREIIDYRWFTPREALTCHHSGSLRLTPPAFVLLTNMALRKDAQTHGRFQVQPRIELFRPRLLTLNDGTCALYQEDAGYASRDLDRAGRRHRLWMRAGGWFYERRMEDESE